MRWQASVRLRAPGRHLDEQRIVVRGEDRAGIGGAAIQANAETRGRAIRGNLAVVRREMFFRVFRGDAALQRRAIKRNLFLRRKRERGFVQRVTLRDEDLRAHQVHARDHFRDRVLHLNPRIHFDEIPLVRIDVVEKLNRARVAILGLARNLPRQRRRVPRESFPAG